MGLSIEERLNLGAKIDAQAESSLLRPDSKLDYAVSNSATNDLPSITVSELQGQFLAIQCQLINAKSVLEVGTLGGYSTIWMAKTGAKVTSIEINPERRNIALENTKGMDVDIRLGAALDVMPKLIEEGKKFDFIFLDASWEEQFEYFQLAVKLTRPNGCIYVDNVIRELLESPTVGEGENLLTKIGRLDNVTATCISTISSHKKDMANRFDGFIMAVVR